MTPRFSFVYKKMLDPFRSSSLTPLYSHSNSSLRKDLESAGFTLENPIFTIFFFPWRGVNSTWFYILQHAEKKFSKYWNIHVVIHCSHSLVPSGFCKNETKRSYVSISSIGAFQNKLINEIFWNSLCLSKINY